MRLLCIEKLSGKKKKGFKNMMELVTGGSGSGKSAYAEDRICALYEEYRKTGKKEQKLYYIATMYPYGTETEEKIADHRRRREGKGFRTLEWYTNITERSISLKRPGRRLDVFF